MNEWIQIAKQLPLGRQQRYRHECSTKLNAIINVTKLGYNLNCYKCGEHLFVPHGARTLPELAELNRRAKEAQYSEKVQLPKDFKDGVPTAYSTWLYKAGISTDVIREVRIGWSESLHRIIIPIYDTDGVLVYWQARAVHKEQKPKYINPRVDKSRTLYLRIPPGSNTQRLCITEDILSCIRVGKHIPCASILGTSLSDGQAIRLARYRRVAIWLDPDTAGRQGSVKCKKKLALMTQADIIYSDVDPKCLPDREIRRCLCLPKQETYTYHGHTIIKDAKASKSI